MVATWPLSSGGDLRLGRSHHQIGFTPQGREPQETHYGRNPSKTWSSFGIDSVSGTGALPAGAGDAFPGPLEAIGRTVAAMISQIKDIRLGPVQIDGFPVAPDRFSYSSDRQMWLALAAGYMSTNRRVPRSVRGTAACARKLGLRVWPPRPTLVPASVPVHEPAAEILQDRDGERVSVAQLPVGGASGSRCGLLATWFLVGMGYQIRRSEVHG